MLEYKFIIDSIFNDQANVNSLASKYDWYIIEKK